MGAPDGRFCPRGRARPQSLSRLPRSHSRHASGTNRLRGRWYPGLTPVLSWGHGSECPSCYSAGGGGAAWSCRGAFSRLAGAPLTLSSASSSSAGAAPSAPRAGVLRGVPAPARGCVTGCARPARPRARRGRSVRRCGPSVPRSASPTRPRRTRPRRGSRCAGRAARPDRSSARSAARPRRVAGRATPLTRIASPSMPAILSDPDAAPAAVSLPRPHRCQARSQNVSRDRPAVVRRARAVRGGARHAGQSVTQMPRKCADERPRRRRPDRDRPHPARARAAALPRALLHRGGARLLRFAAEPGAALRGPLRRQGGGRQGARFGVARLWAWQEIEIAGRPKPSRRAPGRIAPQAGRVGAGAIDLSMTHSRELATAVCVVEAAGG